MRSALQVLSVLILSAVTVACFRGGERDKEVIAGLPGGKCLAPDGRCDSGECNKDRNYCFEATDPCRGFFCGGEERGVCTPDSDGQPSCVCELPYNNDQFDLYCCPSAESGILDPHCATTGEITQDEPAQR